MKITLKQAGRPDREFKGYEGQTILSFLANQGLHVDAPCAGRGQCGKCLVKVTGEVSPPLERERQMPKEANERLACQTKILGETVVEIAAEARFSSVKGLGESEPYDVLSPLKGLIVEMPDRQDSTNLMDIRGIKKCSIRALGQLAELDAARLTGRAIMWGDELLKVEPCEENEEVGEVLAAAVDIGTTGLAVAIIDVVKGEVVAQGTALNPQTTCGGDVISRITMAAEGPEQQAHLQNLILNGLSSLIKEVIGEERRSKIMAAIISANTTMIYLLAGVQPKGLAQAPYRPAFIQGLDLSHLAGRLNLDEGAKIITSPCISAYVGGDITTGMLAVGLEHLPGTVLYIDIGTNGEIVLSHHGKLVATSCAAGPALEGMNILCGQRATPGAIDSFTMNDDYSFRYSTIGEAPATGICGSGLIDLTAELVAHGLIDKTGRLKEPKELPENAPAWLGDLAGGRLNFEGRPVYFDQKDVRQVQLAKGAIAAAVEMLLSKVSMTENDLDEIIIAGAFGFHLKSESLKTIGLIPTNYNGPVRFVGNASLAGAARMALTPNAVEELNELAAATEVLELGFDPQFQSVFVRHLGF